MAFSVLQTDPDIRSSRRSDHDYKRSDVLLYWAAEYQDYSTWHSCGDVGTFRAATLVIQQVVGRDT